MLMFDKHYILGTSALPMGFPPWLSTAQTDDKLQYDEELGP